MSEERKFETLEEILEVIEPTNVFAIVEVDRNDYVVDGDNVITRATDLVDHAVRCMSITERVKAVNSKITVRNAAAYLVPTPKGQAKLFNQYVFINSTGALHDIGLSDLTFVYRLDEKCEITHFPPNAKEDTPILPHHVVV